MAPKTRHGRNVARRASAQRKPLPRISQFLDMPLASWQSRSCGIAALATIIEFYTGAPVSLRTHLKNARAAHAYMLGVGWRHKELAALSSQHGLSGKNFDWATETPAAAWKKFKTELQHGPIIASVYKDFKPSNGGHLIVVSRIAGDLVHYNEPAARTRRGIPRRISIGRFRAGWKRRIISIRPSQETVYVS